MAETVRGRPRRVPVREDLEDIPVYVPGLAPSDVAAGPPPSEVVKLSANENPLGPSPLAVEALQRAAWEAHRYPDSACRALREALAARLGVAASQIVVGNGADNLISLLADALVAPGEAVAVPRVSFSSYAIAARVRRARVQSVPMAGWEIDEEALLAALHQGARVAFLCNPNNPTGLLLSRDRLFRLVDRLPDERVLVLDEAYVEFAEDPSAQEVGPELVRQGAPVVVLRTFSKIYGLAGLRVGYALAPAPVAQAMWRVREVFATNRLAEAAALAALSDEAHVRRSREMVQQGRHQLYGLLGAMGLEYLPSQANFLWVRTGVPSQELVPRLAREGVLVRPGHFWGYPDWLRVTVGTAAQNLRFAEVLGTALHS
ncbi:MAG TPA: histidinol-phosphate transaminase [Limnochordales bacterium]